MPASKLNLLISSTSIDKFFTNLIIDKKKSEFSINGSYYLKIKLDLRECIIGEIYRKELQM